MGAQPDKVSFKVTGPQKHFNDAVIQRLAGMQPYNKSEVVESTPLISFSETVLPC